MTSYILLLLNGIAFASLLYLLSSGLTLIFGLMRVVNLNHGVLYLFGSYAAYTLSTRINSFPLLILLGGLFVVAIGIAQERILLKRLYGQPQLQILLTIGLWFIMEDLILVIWGGYPMNLSAPELLRGSMSVLGVLYPKYRFFLIAIGAVIALALWLIIDKTKLGAIIRAGADNTKIAMAMGINVNKAFIFTFGLGSFLAGIAGVMGAPFLGMEPKMSTLILPLALVVIIVGGLGSLKGAFVGSLFVGIVDTFGRALFPDLSYFTLFVPMALILTFRPEGLFGTKQ